MCVHLCMCIHVHVCVYICVIKKTGLPKILNGSSAESQTSGRVNLPLNYLDYLEKQEKSQSWSCQFPLEQKRATRVKVEKTSFT